MSSIEQYASIVRGFKGGSLEIRGWRCVSRRIVSYIRCSVMTTIIVSTLSRQVGSIVFCGEGEEDAAACVSDRGSTTAVSVLIGMKD